MNIHVSLNRFAGSLIVIMGGAILVGVSSAGATEAPAAIPSSGADLELPSVPVLTTPAGVLPTSPLAALDRFDELVGRTLFTFGIPSLRTQALTHQAAERIAELQLLDAQGIRTRALSVESLQRFSDNIDHAARLALERTLRGNYSLADLRRIARALIIGDDAVLSMSRDALDDADDPSLPGDSDASPLSSERRFIRTLQEYDKTIPDDVLHGVAMELFAAAVRRAEMGTGQFSLPRAPHPRGVIVLHRMAEARRREVGDHLVAGRPRDALPLLHELTIIDELLAVPASSQTVRRDALRIVQTWRRHGNITSEEQQQVESIIRVSREEI